MNELQPIVDIVKQRVTEGESIESLRTELTEKGYSYKQINLIFEHAQLKNISEPKLQQKKNHLKKLIFLTLIILGVLFLLVTYFNETKDNKNIVVSNLTADEYLSNFDYNVLFNVDINNSEATKEFPQAMAEISTGVKHQVQFDGDRPNFLLGAWKGDGDELLFNTITNKLQNLPKGPWLDSARCTILHMDSGCTYGASYFVTDSGHVFAYIDTEVGNVYRNNSDTGLYFFNTKRWTKIGSQIPSLLEDNKQRQFDRFNRESLFVKNNGCQIFFYEDIDGSRQYKKIDLCHSYDIDVKEDSKQLAQTAAGEVTAYLTSGMTTKIGVSETNPLAVGFFMHTFPEPCNRISKKDFNRFKIDMGDGNIIQPECVEFNVNRNISAYGRVQRYEYAKPGIYNIELLYNDSLIFEDIVTVSSLTGEVVFDIEIKENQGKFRNGVLYAEITYATNPVCKLSDKEKSRAYIGLRTKHRDGHNYAEDYGSRSAIEYGACQGVTAWPLTVNPNDRDDTKTLQFEYVVDNVAVATKDITFPVDAISGSQVEIFDASINSEKSKVDNSGTSRELLLPFTISNVSTAEILKIDDGDSKTIDSSFNVIWEYRPTGAPDPVNAAIFFLS